MAATCENCCVLNSDLMRSEIILNLHIFVGATVVLQFGAAGMMVSRHVRRHVCVLGWPGRKCRAKTAKAVPR